VLELDVVIHGADVQTETFWNYSVIVNATVYFYTPQGVHYADVVAANIALNISSSGAGRRRQLLVSAAMSPQSATPGDGVCLWQPDQGTACAASPSTATAGVAGSTQAPMPQQRVEGLAAEATGLQQRDAGVLGGVVSQLWLTAVQAVHSGQVTMITALQHLLHGPSHQQQQQGADFAAALPWQRAGEAETTQDSSSLHLVPPGFRQRRLLSAASNNAVAAAGALGGAGASGVSSQSQGQPVDEIAVSDNLQQSVLC
jgi:hypothetical protein